MKSEVWVLLVFLILVSMIIIAVVIDPYIKSQNRINEKQGCPPKIIYPNGTKICK